MYEDWTESYDPEIQKEYFTHDILFPLPFITMCTADYIIAITITN